MQARFPRDADEKYNPKGEYREKTELLTAKYNKQDRFCFGVGIVDRGDGPQDERIELFNYTTKNIVSINHGHREADQQHDRGDQTVAARPQEVVHHQWR